ncbi:MAG: M90 family metallopeptidase [Pseudomonadota bacterium]
MLIPLLSLVLIAVAITAIWWLPAYNLKRALERPFPPNYAKILRKNIPVYRKMHSDLQLQLKRLIKQFLHQKKFVGCDGLLVTDEVKVTIAANACLLLLNRPSRVYPDLRLILVYPSAFIVPRTEMGIGGVVTHANQTLSGESWSDGRVILAWDHVNKNIDDHVPGHNVVLHEFAHQLDSESGQPNGAPPMMTSAQYERWAAVLSREFSYLQSAVEHRLDSVIDYYGATNPAEFFAVATEAFFETPEALSDHHPELFGQLRAYYQVNPCEWQ